AVEVRLHRRQQVVAIATGQVGCIRHHGNAVAAMAGGAKPQLRRWRVAGCVGLACRRGRRGRRRRGLGAAAGQAGGDGQYREDAQTHGRDCSEPARHVRVYNADPFAFSSSTAMASVLYRSDLPGMDLIHRGKVRDVYALDGERLLIVASDRLSAFDVVLPDPIPGKGELLTRLSNFWFARTAHIAPNHLTGDAVEPLLPAGIDVDQYRRRTIVGKRLRILPVEAIARGYLIGSGWKDYQATGEVCGIALPAGLRQADKLPEPIFTPSTKARIGEHDANIGFDEMVRTVGADLAEQVRDITLAVY